MRHPVAHAADLEIGDTAGFGNLRYGFRRVRGLLASLPAVENLTVTFRAATASFLSKRARCRHPCHLNN